MAMMSSFDEWQAKVRDWLKSPNPEQSKLADWLAGYDGPGIDRYTEGFTWLFKAVQGDDEESVLLAKQAAIMLESYRLGTLRPSARLASNLLYLCVELRQSRLLGEPLAQMLKDKTVPPKGDPEREWSYQGASLMLAFRGALAYNQADAKLRQVWIDMLEGKPDPYLLGTPMDGYEGVLGLPGKPEHVLVAWALSWMARFIDKAPDRVGDFKRLIAMAERRFPGEEWDWEINALRCAWPDWARESLDPTNLRLTIKIELGSAGAASRARHRSLIIGANSSD